MRRQTFACRLPIASVVLALAACQSSPEPLPVDRPGMAWPHAAADVSPLDPEAIWSVGDRVCYRVASNADGEVREWRMQFELRELPPPTGADVPGKRTQHADPASCRIRMRNAYPNSMTDKGSGKRSFRYANSGSLQVTCTRLDGAGEISVDVETQLQGHVWMPSVDAHPGFGLTFLFGVLMRVDRLMEELLAVVRPPSMLSVLANGMKVLVRLDLDRPDPLEVVEVDSPFGKVPAYWLPATIQANGQDALHCRFLITWVQSPLLLTFGVLRIEGHHPDDPERRIVAHLVDARRGVDPQAVDPVGRLGPPGLRIGMTERELLAAVDGDAIARYRHRHPTRPETVDLLVVDLPKPWGRFVAVVREGSVVYGAFPGWVNSYLRLRGYDLAKGPYAERFAVPGARDPERAP